MPRSARVFTLYHTIDFGTISIVKTSPVYDWSVEKYIRAIENTSNPLLRGYEQVEIDYIRSIPDLSIKTLIDIGAGYGRVLPHIAPPLQEML